MIINTPPIGVQTPISNSPSTMYPIAVPSIGSNRSPTETIIGGIHLSDAFNPVCPRRPAPSASAVTGRRYDASIQPNGWAAIESEGDSRTKEVRDSMEAEKKVTGNA